jgi:putative nucleotidyltransferase with HDIG domain
MLFTAALNRATRLYVGAVTSAGIFAIAQAAFSLAAEPADARWLLLAALTLISGSANVRVTAISATISVSETFVCTSVLLFGPGAGTITVALDALVMSLWMKRRYRSELYRLLFNIAAPAISVWIAGHVFFLITGTAPLSRHSGQIPLVTVALPLLAFTVLYFLLNSWLIAIAIAIKDGLSAFIVWRDNLLWTSFNYFGGASVAALIIGYRSTFDVGLLLIIAPILLVLYYTFRSGMGRVEDANRHLAELNRLYFSTIETLAMAIDAKDQVTHGHIRRVQTFAVELAKSLGVTTSDQLKAIEAAALLHDMGKLAVPEHILNKPGPLNPSELARMKTHASIGADILSSIEFPYPVVPIVRHHHENWDGTGYPDGLKGTEIPVGARILAVVDCFDALTSDRPYRPRLSTKDALEILASRRGTMYDPLVVDTFGVILGKLQLQDEQPPPIVVRALAKTPRVADERAPVVSRRFLDASQLALNSLLRSTPAKVAILFVADEDATRLVATIVAGTNEERFRQLEISVGDRLSGWVAANGRPIVNSDPALDLGHQLAAKHQLGNAVSVPAKAGAGEAVAVLTAYANSDRAFSPAEVTQIILAVRQLEPLWTPVAE